MNAAEKKALEEERAKVDAIVSMENAKPENQRANRIKAIDITIDSLKQYLTLSTVSIVALLTFYNGSEQTGNKTHLFITILLFIACAIISVTTINAFINKVHDNVTNTRDKALRRLNICAISFFICGVASAAIFIKNTPINSNESNAQDGRILIHDDSIEIGKDVKMQIRIMKDSLANTKTILIN